GQASLDGALRVLMSPTLASVTPLAPFSASASTLIQIDGSNFRSEAPPSLALTRAGSSPVALTDITWVGASRLLASLPAGVPAGTYDVVVTDRAGCSATLPQALPVTYLPLGALSLEPQAGWQRQNQAIAITNTVSDPATQSPFTGTPEVWITAPL